MKMTVEKEINIGRGKREKGKKRITRTTIKN